jgi:hypothetical protein
MRSVDAETAVVRNYGADAELTARVGRIAVNGTRTKYSAASHWMEERCRVCEWSDGSLSIGLRSIVFTFSLLSSNHLCDGGVFHYTK